MRSTLMTAVVLALFLGGNLGDAAGADTWATYRGNVQRTGNVDGKAGPTAGKVLWSHGSQEHFIAAPVVADDRVYVTGLGTFNVSTLYCLSGEPTAAKRIV